MNKIALCIPRPGISASLIQQGYIDTLRHCGWKVYVSDPKTKLGCRKLIEEYGVSLILTHSRYGIRQLPIDIINKNDVTVMVNILPSNNNKLTIDSPYELAHEDEASLINEINSAVSYTNIEKHLWDEYMHIWMDNNVYLSHVPTAGNITRALPPTCSALTDVAMVANFTNKQRIMRQLIAPLFNRITMLGYTYQAFGDNIWKLAGLTHNGQLNDEVVRLSHVYATAKVCPNVHTEKQIALQACVNDSSFMIPLCGGVLVSDNHMVSRYLGHHCCIAISITDFINKVIDTIRSDESRFEKIKAGVEHIAHNHTYFNRLDDLFNFAKLYHLADEVSRIGNTLAIRHCLELNTRLDTEKRGIPYGKEEIGIT